MDNVAAGAAAAAAARQRASPAGGYNPSPPPLDGGDQSKLAAIMARQRQAAEAESAERDDEEETVETFEEIIEEEVVEEEVTEVEEEHTDEGDDGDRHVQENNHHSTTGGELAAGSTPNMSASEMSVEEFSKGDAPTPVAGVNSTYMLGDDMQEQGQEDDHLRASPVDLNGNPKNGGNGMVAPMPVSGAQPDVDDPQDAYGQDAQQQQQAYGMGGPSGNDPYAYDNGYNQDPYNQDPYMQQADEFGMTPYGQPMDDMDPGQEAFQDEEQPLPPSQARGMPDQSKLADEEDEDSSYLTVCLMIACCLLVVAMAGVGLILYFWLADDPFKDDPKNVTVLVTPAPAAPRNNDLPTASPTPSPTPVPQPATFSLSNTLTTTDPSSKLGETVAIAGVYLVAGEPGLSGGGNTNVGELGTFTRNGGSSTFDSTSTASSGGSENFGEVVDIVQLGNGDLAALIGAPRTKGAVLSDYRFGAAYYLTFDSSTNTWSNLGGTIRSDETLQESGGRFGDAVALAKDVQRIVVGAPDSSKDDPNFDTGRVFTFEFSGGTWNRATTLPYLEGATKSYLGSAIDMTDDGTRLVVGGPGSGTANGVVNYYEWNDNNNDWDEIFSISGTSSESLGTDVVFVEQDESDGIKFIVGGPTLNDDAGVAVVYVQTSTNPSTFIQLGNPIQGSAGDRLGESVAGREGRIALGTTAGFRVYDFNADSDEWEHVGGSPVATDSAVVDIAISDDGKTVVVGLASREVRVYDL